MPARAARCRRPRWLAGRHSVTARSRSAARGLLSLRWAFRPSRQTGTCPCQLFRESEDRLGPGVDCRRCLDHSSQRLGEGNRWGGSSHVAYPDSTCRSAQATPAGRTRRPQGGMKQGRRFSVCSLASLDYTRPTGLPSAGARSVGRCASQRPRFWQDGYILKSNPRRSPSSAPRIFDWINENFTGSTVSGVPPPA